MMIINSNIPALNAFNALNSTNNAIQKSIQQISTGLRINSAADDASGLAISEKIRTQTKGLDTALKNSEDGISLLQTAEGALSETHSILQRMRELAVQAANDTLTSQDRSYIQMEIDELKQQIDNIADSTSFNRRNLLDGSACGKWSSNNIATEAYIRGAIENEGNFNIEITAAPGMAQVQKSSIFKIRSKDVVTDEQTDNSLGLNNGVAVSGVPSGNYQITANKAGGGEATYTYTSTVTGTVENGNTGGLSETLSFRFTGIDRSSGSDVTRQSSAISVSIPNGTDKAGVAALIASELNDRTYRLGNAEFELTASSTLDGQYTISATSQNGELSSISFSSSGGSSIVNSISNSNTPSNVYNVALTGRATSGSGGSTEITVTVTDGSNTDIYTVPVSASADADTITQALGNISNFTKTQNEGNFNLSTEYSGGFYNLKASGGNGSMTISLSPDIFQNATPSRSSSTTYSTTGTGTVSSANTSTNTETVRVYVSRYSYSNSDSNAYIEVAVDPSDSANNTPAKIAENIAAAARARGMISVNGSNVFLNGSYTSGNGYTLTTTGSGHQLYFRPSIISSGSATTDVNNANFTTEKTASVSTSATVNLTGTYGIDSSAVPTASVKAATATSASSDSGTQNNASILFEVTGTSYDEISGIGTVTLRANSHVMGVDGAASSYSDSKIVLSSGKPTANLGYLIGEDDDHFKLTLDPSQIANFKSGSKFIYNISGNGDEITGVDTSLYISGQQDNSWPYSWGSDDVNYFTKNNTPIQINVNAEAVSNQSLHFKNFYLNSDSGKVYTGDITLGTTDEFGAAAVNFPEPATPETPAYPITLSSFTANYAGKIATGDTQLKDIDRFYDKQGVFMLEEPQTIKISQGDGRSANITLYATDTLNQVRDKLNDAIAEGLGQNLYVANGDPHNFVSFVENTSDVSGMETVDGTFVVRSLIPGSSGELTFSSAYGDLIDAFGFNTIQNSADTTYTASVYNSHSGATVARGVKLSGNILKGVVDKNVDVKFDAMAGMRAVWSDSQKNYIYRQAQSLM